ncbi:MAG: hypothetical protein EP335_16085 [Alphaproteobacteria bacterium]|nr:MAG: hypothetical protein EP335_16085 [Alphaproteobacteria bacterium]
MKAEDFELLVLLHGPEPADWPADSRTVDALAFAASDAGRGVLAREQAFRARLLAADPVPDAGGDAFMNRLLDIPIEHAQAKPSFLARLAGMLADSRQLFSPVGYAAQGAACAVLLMTGVMIGISNPAEETTELDLSASLFASTDLDLGGQ